MTDQDTHPALRDYDLDEDYVDNEPERAEVVVDLEKSTSRSGFASLIRESVDEDALEPENDAPVGSIRAESVDHSHRYNRDDDAMSGTAVDVKIDRREISDRDDRGGTRTGFDGTEGGDFYGKRVYRDGRERNYAQWLRLLHDGYRSNRRKQDNYDADKQRWIDAITAELDVTPHQKRRVEHIVEDINMRYMAFYPTELVILAITSLVVNHDDRWIRNEDQFKHLVMDIDGSMDDVKNARLLVKEKTDRI
jgi:hypothetical protein